MFCVLFQIPQRYRFSSKSQLLNLLMYIRISCFRYHKGTDFQANHNSLLRLMLRLLVVLDTTKVQIFKQITTVKAVRPMSVQLFQIPQRYRFSSKSQHYAALNMLVRGCFRYHKGTDFQANHNSFLLWFLLLFVVLDTTKVQIFKQITTPCMLEFLSPELFQIPQRYRFSSKSQHQDPCEKTEKSCFRYHKGTDFQANHNSRVPLRPHMLVVLDTTKVQIFKQITTLLH